MSGSERSWRTREDVFAGVEGELRDLVGAYPELDAKLLLEHVQRLYPGRYEESHLRTLQRRVRQWRLELALSRKSADVVFEQKHVPGELAELDWKVCDSLGVRIGGELLPHRLCHLVLVYSGMEWAVVCRSEDRWSVRLTLQSGFREFGGVTLKLQVDSCSAATKPIGQGKPGREFAPEFVELLGHFGLSGRRITVGRANENGTVEAQHGSLYRRLKAALALRGSTHFGTVEEYVGFVEGVVRGANGQMRRRLRFELERPRLLALPRTEYAEYEEIPVSVGKTALFRVRKKVYSAPVGLVGRALTARLYGERVELWEGPRQVYETARVHGSGTGVKWRHLVGHLVRKPGAFARYVHRDALVPGAAWGSLLERLLEREGERRGVKEYLLALEAACAFSDTVGERVVERMLAGELGLSVEGFRAGAGCAPVREALCPYVADLRVYDELLEEVYDDSEWRSECGSELVSEAVSSADDGPSGGGAGNAGGAGRLELQAVSVDAVRDGMAGPSGAVCGAAAEGVGAAGNEDSGESGTVVAAGESAAAASGASGGRVPGAGGECAVLRPAGSGEDAFPGGVGPGAGGPSSAAGAVCAGGAADGAAAGGAAGAAAGEGAEAFEPL